MARRKSYRKSTRRDKNGKFVNKAGRNRSRGYNKANLRKGQARARANAKKQMSTRKKVAVGAAVGVGAAAIGVVAYNKSQGPRYSYKVDKGRAGAKFVTQIDNPKHIRPVFGKTTKTYMVSKRGQLVGHVESRHGRMPGKKAAQVGNLYLTKANRGRGRAPEMIVAHAGHMQGFKSMKADSYRSDDSEKLVRRMQGSHGAQIKAANGSITKRTTTTKHHKAIVKQLDQDFATAKRIFDVSVAPRAGIKGKKAKRR